MRIVRDVILKADKKITFTMIGISVLMLILSLLNFSINFAGGVSVTLQFGGLWAAGMSILPLTWGVSVFMLMKTKNTFFAKLPSYVICGMIVILLILYYIALGNDNVTRNLLFFAVAILLIYPFIIATLTLEGRLYNIVFATAFSTILLIISLIAAVVVCVLLKSIMFSLLVPALVYTQLILIVFAFELKKPERKNQD